METWDEIRDEIAGMLADGKPLEDVLAKLEQRKNEMAKENLIAVMDEMIKAKPQTEQEYIQTCTTEQLAELFGHIAKNAYQCGQNGKTNKCVNRNHCTGYCDYGWVEWLKQPHKE